MNPFDTKSLKIIKFLIKLKQIKRHKCSVLMFGVCRNSYTVTGISRKETVCIRCNIINLRLPFRMFSLHLRSCSTYCSQIPYIRSTCTVKESILCICCVGNGTLRPEAFIGPFFHFLGICQVFFCAVNPYKIIRCKIFAEFICNVIRNGTFDSYKIIAGKEHGITAFIIILRCRIRELYP